MKNELNNDVLINRKIMSWEWYKDVNTYKLFTHLIYKANYEDSLYRGVKVLRGQVYTGLDRLKFETGLSLQQARTSINKLISSNDITSKSTNKYRLITVLNYDKYQLTNKQINKQSNNLPNSQSNKELTGNLTASNKVKELKQIKEVKESNNKTVVYFENVELNNLFKDFLKQRKSPKVKNTERSINLLLGKLEPFDDNIKIEMINNSLVSGWASIFPIKDTNKSGVKNKNLLPKDIECEWLDDYIKEVDSGINKVSMGDRNRYCKAHNININECPNDDVVLKWLR